MDTEIKKLRNQLGLKYRLDKKYLRPEARNKSGAEIIRDLRKEIYSKKFLF